MMHNQRGVTFIELMVAFAIFAVGIAGFVQYQHYAQETLRTNMVYQQALLLAENQLIQVKQYTSVDPNVSPGSYHQIENQRQEKTVNATAYTISTEVFTHEKPDYKRLTVTVTWKDAALQQQSLSISSLISKTDPAKQGVL